MKSKNTKQKSNLATIQDYIDGVRPVIQAGYVPIEKQRKVGEMWTDSKGTKWIQKDGYKTNINEQADIIRKARKMVCLKCKKDLDWSCLNLDKKMFRMTSQCFDCVIDHENKLRIEGKYKNYEQKKVLMNMLSKCYDVMEGLRDSYNYLKSDDGEIKFQEYVGLKQDLVQEESWGKLDNTQVKKDIRDEFKYLAKEAYKIKKQIKSIVI